MYYDKPRVPALPGQNDVTDGSVDYYGTDWENVDNGVPEAEMLRCLAQPCVLLRTCSDNQPEQTDVQPYEIVLE